MRSSPRWESVDPVRRAVFRIRYLIFAPLRGELGFFGCQGTAGERPLANRLTPADRLSLSRSGGVHPPPGDVHRESDASAEPIRSVCAYP
jgi:hypothetical protein